MTGIWSSLHFMIPKCHSSATPERFFLKPYKETLQYVISSSFTLSSTTCSRFKTWRKDTRRPLPTRGSGLGDAWAAPQGAPRAWDRDTHRSGAPSPGTPALRLPGSWSLSSAPAAGFASHFGASPPLAALPGSPSLQPQPVASTSVVFKGRTKHKAQLFNWPKTENGGLPSPYSATCRLYSFVKKRSLPACDYVYFFRSEMKYFSRSHLQNKDFFSPWMFPPKLRVRHIRRNFQLKLVDFEYQR